MRAALPLSAVSARRLAAVGPVVCMSVLSMPPHQYLLVVHEGSGAVVWDLRAQVMVALCSSGGSSAESNGNSSKLAATTAAAWLPGSSKGDFATGHQDGAVCIWDMPASACSSTASPVSNGTVNRPVSKLPGDLLQQQQRQTLQATLVSQLQGDGSSSDSRHKSRHATRYRPVTSLQFIAGAVECLCVFGGNDVDRPDGLTLVPLPEPTQVYSGWCMSAPLAGLEVLCQEKRRRPIVP
jgi:hypothetical protein